MFLFADVIIKKVNIKSINHVVVFIDHVVVYKNHVKVYINHDVK